MHTLKKPPRVGLTVYLGGRDCDGIWPMISGEAFNPPSSSVIKPAWASPGVNIHRPELTSTHHGHEHERKESQFLAQITDMQPGCTQCVSASAEVSPEPDSVCAGTVVFYLFLLFIY